MPKKNVEALAVFTQPTTIEEMQALPVPDKLTALFNQAMAIAEFHNYRLIDLLKSQQMVDFFIQDRVENVENPITPLIVARSQEVKSYAIIFYGLREYVDSVLANRYPGQGIVAESLETKNQLEANPANWLRIGDIITGFGDATRDNRGPRKITNITEERCFWAYVAEPEMEERPASYDKFFQRRDWIRIEISGETWQENLDDCWRTQNEEIEGLTALYDYLNNREFLPPVGE